VCSFSRARTTWPGTRARAIPVASISLARPNWPHASYTRQGQLKGEIRGDCAPTIAARRQGARQRPCRSFVSIHGRQPWIRSPSRSACNWARYVATGAGGLPPSSTQSKERLGDAETGAWVTRMTLPIDESGSCSQRNGVRTAAGVRETVQPLPQTRAAASIARSVSREGEIWTRRYQVAQAAWIAG